MDKRDLTDRSQDEAPADAELTWRGFSYLEQIQDLLPETFDGGADVTHAQRCWVGYVRSTDEFLLGFDLWLKNEVEDSDDTKMAGGFAWVRLALADGAINATVVKTERFSDAIYSGALDVIEDRFTDLVVLDLD